MNVRDVLEAARPYVDNAYEAAFPDYRKNEQVLRMIDDALAVSPGELNEATKAETVVVAPAADHKTVRMVFSASVTSLFGAAPAYAVIEVNEDFFARAQGMIDLCVKHGLSEVRQSAAIDWGPRPSEWEAPDPEFAVRPNGQVWYSSPVAGEEHAVKTGAVSLKAAHEAFANAAPGSTIAAPCCDDALQAYQDDQADGQGEPGGVRPTPSAR